MHPDIAITGAIEIALAQSATGSSSNCGYWIQPRYATTGNVIGNGIIRRNVVRRSPRAVLFAANVGGSNGALSASNNWFIDCGAPSGCLPSTNHAITLRNCGAGLVSASSFLQCNNPFTQNSLGAVVFVPRSENGRAKTREFTPRARGADFRRGHRACVGR